MINFFNSPLGIAILAMLLLIVVYIFKVKRSSKEEEDINEHEKQVAVSKVSSLKEETIIKENKQDDLELVAAIMGALSAHLDVPASKLKIKSIKRADGNTSTWRREGLEEF